MNLSKTTSIVRPKRHTLSSALTKITGERVIYDEVRGFVNRERCKKRKKRKAQTAARKINRN